MVNTRVRVFVARHASAQITNVDSNIPLAISGSSFHGNNVSLPRVACPRTHVSI
jgi:hypothetical protein